MQVRNPTYNESPNFLSLLNVSDCKIKQLDDLNVTRSVCGVLAAHETAKKLGRSFQEEKVRTYSILVSFHMHLVITLNDRLLSTYMYIM